MSTPSIPRILRPLCMWMLLAVGCSIPGRLYLVAPAISGSVQSLELPDESALLRLRVMYTQSPVLYQNQETVVSADGSFGFEPVKLAVAGHEYDKRYRAFLTIHAGGRTRVIWRADFSRLDLAGPIGLDCDLERPMSEGQPCWVADPLGQPWLIAQGRRTYLRLCVGCHGKQARGGTTGDAALGLHPPDLTKIAARRGGRFDRREITEWIDGRARLEAHGTRRMPIWGEQLHLEYARYVDGDEMIGATLDPVVAYLESLQVPD